MARREDLRARLRQVERLFARLPRPRADVWKGIIAYLVLTDFELAHEPTREKALELWERLADGQPVGVDDAERDDMVRQIVEQCQLADVTQPHM